MRFAGNSSGSLRTALGSLALVAAMTQPAIGQVYHNNFQTAGSETNGLTWGGTLSGLTRSSLPTDGGGLGSGNQSMWLGPIGQNVGKSPTTSELVNLALNNLVVGQTYFVSFDLLIGSSWDGSAGYYGPDSWKLTAVGTNLTTLVDATFSNCGVYNQLCGANSPQSYSDATPIGGVGLFAPETGADYFSDTDYNYGNDYGIYWFGHGAGNPMLSFVADAQSMSLVFERTPVSSGDSGDEYWALDNIDVSGPQGPQVTAAPEPSSLVLLATGVFAVAVGARRRRKAVQQS